VPPCPPDPLPRGQQQSCKKVSIAQLSQACFDWLSPFRISVFLLFPV
jgi:hypothetical protein